MYPAYFIVRYCECKNVKLSGISSHALSNNLSLLIDFRLIFMISFYLRYSIVTLMISVTGSPSSDFSSVIVFL